MTTFHSLISAPTMIPFSANGSFVNDTPLDAHVPVPLEDGDEITLGQTTLVFQAGH